MDGILLVDKPSGITSHDVIDELRRLFEQRRIGHTGTLDPMATGLLVVMLGRATRLAPWLQADDKEYEGSIKFGVTTDTLDADGRVLAKRPCKLTQEQLKEAIKPLIGRITQVPPMVSALKISGQKLYTLARQGVEVERPPRDVEIYQLSAELIEPDDFPVARFRVRCSKGTYVRSLVADLADSLGCLAHLTALQRTQVGRFGVEQARTVDELRRLANQGQLESVVIPMSAALPQIPAFTVDAATARAVTSGQAVSVNGLAGLAEGADVRLLDDAGNLICVARVVDVAGRRRAKPVAVFG